MKPNAIKLKRGVGGFWKVPLPDGVTEVAGVIISGDEILVWPVHSDPEGYNRIYDSYEGPFYKVPKDGEWVEVDYDEVDDDKCIMVKK